MSFRKRKQQQQTKDINHKNLNVKLWNTKTKIRILIVLNLNRADFLENIHSYKKQDNVKSLNLMCMLCSDTIYLLMR